MMRSRRELASALATGFQYDQTHGVSLPRQVQISLPSNQLTFTLQTQQHIINQLSGDPAQLWTLPQISGYPYVNLAAPGQSPATGTGQPLAAEPGSAYELRYADQRNAAIRRLPPFDRLR